MLKEYAEIWNEEAKNLKEIAEDLLIKLELNPNFEAEEQILKTILDVVLDIETKIFRARIKLEREINYRRFK